MPYASGSGNKELLGDPLRAEPDSQPRKCMHSNVQETGEYRKIEPF